MKIHKIKTYRNQGPLPLFKDYLQSYVNKLLLDDRLKISILDDQFIQNNPSYYLYYPYLFSSSFDVTKNIDLLTIAGFLYYKSIIILDEIFDHRRFSSYNFFLANICQEETIKILTSLFGIDSSFWGLWNKRKYEYTYSLKTDKELKEINSFEVFEKLADSKSAFGKIAIDALHKFSITKNEPLYANLLESHKYFYSSFQIVDDLDDFKEDFEIGQFNIGIEQLKIELVKRHLDFKNYSIDDLHKFLYIFGTAERLIDVCIDYLEKSECLLNDYSLDQWKTEIRRLHNTAVTRKLNIHAFIKCLAIKQKLSQENCLSHPQILDSISNGIKFIDSSQNEDGSWYEYYNDAGLSDTWATAFILSFICQSYIRSHFSELTFVKAHSFLNYQNEESWGYNSSWITDADSTTFVLLAALSENKEVNEASLPKWLHLQIDNGAFSTYRNSEELLASLNSDSISDVSGWLEPHTCVSSVAFYFLSKANSSLINSYENLKKYLISTQQADGLWSSYWWTSPIYSTAYMIKSSVYTDDIDIQVAIKNSIKAMLNLQNDNGSFGNGYIKDSPFYTGCRCFM